MLRRTRLSAALVLAPLIALLITATPVAATSPATVLGYIDGDVAFTRDGTYQNVTGLDNLAAGTWWISATASVDETDGVNLGSGETSCRIRTGTDTTEDEATWAL